MSADGPPADAAQDLTPDEEKMVKKVYDGKIEGDIDPATTVALAEHYMQGVFKGYGGNFDRFDYDTPNHRMLANLQKNVYQFAAAKNYTQLRELTDALMDGKRLRTYREFREVASNIVGEYSKYTRTEYNTAVSGALNAANWVGYQEHKKLMPNLKYVTVGDARVREAHRILDGTVRPIDDDFWKTHYPPLSWNCRCTTYQLPGKSTVTPTDKIPHVDIPKMFQVNLAEHNLVFPKGSAFFVACPEDVREAALALLPPLPEKPKK